MPGPSGEIRKRILFEREIFDALQLLARDRTATLQELIDEAVADLLHKHHRPVTVGDMLRASADGLSAGAAPKARRRRSTARS